MCLNSSVLKILTDVINISNLFGFYFKQFPTHVFVPISMPGLILYNKAAIVQHTNVHMMTNTTFPVVLIDTGPLRLLFYYYVLYSVALLMFYRSQNLPNLKGPYI